MANQIKITKITLLLWFIFHILLGHQIFAANDAQIRIGVLAKRGSEKCLESWEPTADYLSTQISEYTFRIIPLKFDEIIPSVKNGTVDFILTNPSFYVELEYMFNVSRIVTMRNLRKGLVVTKFGGVIFTKAERSDIKTLEDFTNNTFMAVKETSFGGWRMAYREFIDAGINPYQDFKSLQFAGTHDSVVFAVAKGIVDGGTVRTEILERLAAAGRIRISDFQVIHEHKGEFHLPFVHSTRAYPEWPLASLSHISDDLAAQVASQLLLLPKDCPPALAAQCAGWTVPMNYQPVHDCLKALRLGPYENYGNVTFDKVIRQYWLWIIVITLLVMALSLAIIRVTLLNSRLRSSELKIANELNERKKAEIALQNAYDNLEQRVTERTAELDQLNKRLQEDIKKQKQTESELTASEKRFRDLADLLPQAIVETDLNGNLIYANRIAISIFGYEEQDFDRNMNVLQFLADEDKERAMQNVNRIFAGEKIGGSEYTAIRKDGSKFSSIMYSDVIIQNNEPSGLRAIIVDITELKSLEEQLRQSQKLEGIGQLAGGIAHDFNNILTAINGYAELALLHLDKDKEPTLTEDIRHILDSSKRAENLIRQLLAFSRKQIINPQIVDLNQRISDLYKMLQRMIGEDFKLELNLTKNIERIQADPSQLEQIIINLVINARDAVNLKTDRASEKLISIATKSVSMDKSFVALHPGSTEGQYAQISVTDSGIGMNPETVLRIFEPFFTTKEWGKGTGLGLSTVYGIVKQNKGTLVVESEPSVGTTFNIYWPSLAKLGKIKEISSLEQEVKGGHETVLFVEDEKMVRNFAVKSLTRLGYKVYEAENGQQALDLVQTKKLQYDIIVTDVIMPKMNGEELVSNLQKIHTGFKVLYCSGYTDSPLLKNGSLRNGISYLDKPYSGAILAKKVREILDKR